jgi:glycosyltransferase involved in cell wall biosynthesis
VSSPADAAQTHLTSAAGELDAVSEKPLVSVVLPCYREPIAVLRRSIDSILGQTYSHIELIVVLDDPAAKAKAKFLEELAEKDDRVTVVLNPENLGPWASYNRGVREAKGAIIAIQDSDDVSLPDRIEALTRYLLDRPSVGVVGSAVDYVDEASGRTMMTRTYPADAADAIRRYSPLAHPATLRWARLFATNGGYDVSSRYRHAADYELWCRWLTGGVEMANVPDVTYRYFQSDTNFKTQNVRAILRDTVRIKARYARRLRFRIGDYLWLAAEAVACMMPSRVVVAAFYLMNRRRSAGLLGSSGASLKTTQGIEYTRRLKAPGSKWKHLVNTQAAYRWNVRRLNLGFVLDVGCGIGRNLAHLDGHGIGVDHNRHSVAEARARGLEAYTVEEFTSRMGSGRGTFDSLLFSHVLEHMSADEGRRLLLDYLHFVKNEGKIVVIVPQGAGFKSDASHVQYLDRAGLAALTAPLPLKLNRVYSFPFPSWASGFFRYNETVAVYSLSSDRPADA